MKQNKDLKTMLRTIEGKVYSVHKTKTSLCKGCCFNIKKVEYPYCRAPIKIAEECFRKKEVGEGVIYKKHMIKKRKEIKK